MNAEKILTRLNQLRKRASLGMIDIDGITEDDVEVLTLFDLNEAITDIREMLEDPVTPISRMCPRCGHRDGIHWPNCPIVHQRQGGIE